MTDGSAASRLPPCAQIARSLAHSGFNQNVASETHREGHLAGVLAQRGRALGEQNVRGPAQREQEHEHARLWPSFFWTESLWICYTCYLEHAMICCLCGEFGAHGLHVPHIRAQELSASPGAFGAQICG